MFSKIELGERCTKKEWVLILAKLLDTTEEELLPIGLENQLYDLLKDKKIGLASLKIVERKLKDK